MSESTDAATAVKAKSRTDLIIELSQLIDEVRLKVRKARSEKAYGRFVGILTTLYGILLKAESGEVLSEEDRGEIEKAMAHLIKRIPRRVELIERIGRRVRKIVPQKGVVIYAV